MNLEKYYKKYSVQIDDAIYEALKEDRISKDVTTSIYFRRTSQTVKAELVCKEFCLLAGFDIFRKVLGQVSDKFRIKHEYDDGDRLRPGSVVAEITGPVDKLLMAERTALNFIQRMTGVATLTSRFVTLLRFRDSEILHTRKTTPNFRVFELAAVLIGGGQLHRTDLSSAVMIKDNHICAAGSVTKALQILRDKKLNIKTVIEVRSMDELKEVIELGKDIIEVVMLDNFNNRDSTKAIKLLKDNDFKIEVSGGININNFSRMQHRGIDYYSIGAITHSYVSVDFSLDF